MSFDAIELEVVRQTIRAFGVSVSITSPSPLGPFVAVIDRDAQFVVQQSQAVGIRTEIEFLRSDVVPARGWLVTDGTDTFRIEDQVETSAAKYVTRWGVAKQ